MSAASTLATGAVYVAPTPGGNERLRAAAILENLVVVNESGCEPDKFYAQWAGGFVEITDELISTAICPADLLGVPCEWDEILEGGCGLIRLCKSISKYTFHHCPDGPDGRDPKAPAAPRKCGHIHHEVDISCRFVATAHMYEYRVCKQVLWKNRRCAAGHDFEDARMKARDEYDAHWEAAREAGSVGQVEFGWTF